MDLSDKQQRPVPQGPRIDRTFFRQNKKINKINKLKNKIILVRVLTEILLGALRIVHKRNTRAP
ncbi:MAG: hypothetical protein A2Y50_00255 [Pseudomonadales bacterium RIFCSPLOWO2_12_59_9]|nr:MAG: hypothetical protein A2Y50_00255 [Pseudomonadales bacterium RIFCSPLOWO2_12_59_9]